MAAVNAPVVTGGTAVMNVLVVTDVTNVLSVMVVNGVAVLEAYVQYALDV